MPFCVEMSTSSVPNTLVATLASSATSTSMANNHTRHRLRLPRKRAAPLPSPPPGAGRRQSAWLPGRPRAPVSVASSLARLAGVVPTPLGAIRVELDARAGELAWYAGGTKGEPLDLADPRNAAPKGREDVRGAIVEVCVTSSRRIRDGFAQVRTSLRRI